MKNTQKKKTFNDKKKYRYKYIVASCIISLAIRISFFFVFTVLEGSGNEYISKIISIDEHLHNVSNSIKYGFNKNKELELLKNYYQQNKRGNQLKQLLFKNDYMNYSFTSGIYDFKYIYDSYVLIKLYKNIYGSLTLRINPLFLKLIHFITFKKIQVKNNILSNVVNYYEFRYYLFIALIDILTAIFLFLIVEKLRTWNDYFSSLNEEKKEGWSIINSILLINIYLNNPLSIFSNSILSLDNFKLLIITISFYLAILRINKFSNKIFDIINFFVIIFANTIILYVSSFHFILIIIGINNFIICINDNINKYDIKQTIQSYKLFLMLIKNLFLILATLTAYLVLILVSSYFNQNSLFFLNNTLVNEYKVLFLSPNLGNYWYIFSLMFKRYNYSYLFLFHFHMFLYPIPLFFRLSKTPLIYLKVMISIVLLFHPNITVIDIVYSLSLLAIDYEKTIYTIPFAKLLMLILVSLGLFTTTMNLWIGKNTANANYIFFNQLMAFNIIAYIIINSMKFYIRAQTPRDQIEEGKCISVSKKKKRNFKIIEILKKAFS